MNLHVVSFGCQMSVADGEEMSRPLVERGFRPTDRLDEADAVIVNTCTVRQHAEDKALSLIGRLKPWKEERPSRFLIVAGCAAERLGDWLRQRFPHIDLVVGAKSIEQYPQILNDAMSARFDWNQDNQGAWTAPFAPSSPDAGEGKIEFRPAERAGDHHTPLLGEEGRGEGGVCRYVTIMRGCNYSCAYCIVPAVRGREIYRPIDTILSEIRNKADQGTREVMLLGQTVNSYRGPGGENFADLLRAADAVDGIERIRFMSPHPYYVDDRMIGAMAESKHVCPHLHLPLQSGSDRILARMRRNYTKKKFLDAVIRLRRAIPNIAITTDVIAGFPGESEDDFQETLRLVDELDPCSAYVFKYSARPGTEAASFQDQIANEIIEERHRRLLALIDAKMERHLSSQIGKSVRILLENDHWGKTEYYFNAEIEGRSRPGEVIEAVVTGVSRTGLKAQVVSEPALTPVLSH